MTNLRKLFSISNLPSLDKELILCHILKIERVDLYKKSDIEIQDKTNKAFTDLVKKREEGFPLAYITGIKPFWDDEFQVNESTLIPRPESELLVETAISFDLENCSLLELGTGSGAIGMSIAKEKPFWTCTLTDKSFEALSVARENMKALNLKNSVLIQHDWHKRWLFEPMDLIISNPPYIYRNDLDGDEDGIWFEPPSALFSEKKGLADISTIVKNSVTFLKENGKLLLEHGFDQKDPINKMANQNDYSDVSFLKDLNGKWRVACLTK